MKPTDQEWEYHRRFGRIWQHGLERNLAHGVRKPVSLLRITSLDRNLKSEIYGDPHYYTRALAVD